MSGGLTIGRRKPPRPLKYRVISYVIDAKNLGMNAETAAMNGRATGGGASLFRRTVECSYEI